MRTSAPPAIRARMARPSAALRSSVTLFLLPFSSRKNQASRSGRSDSARRPGSPPGGSILMTSAPSHASIWAQLGPASYCVRSSTTIPSSALAIRFTWGASTGPPSPHRSETPRLNRGAPRARFIVMGPRRPPKLPAMLGGVGRETDRRGAGLVVGLDVDHGRLAGRIGPLERRANLVRLLDELAVPAEVLGGLVIPGVPDMAGERGLPRVSCPGCVVADD